MSGRTRRWRAYGWLAFALVVLAAAVPASGAIRAHSTSSAISPVRPFTPVQVSAMRLLGVHTISVTVVGPGSVVSSPGTIDCPSITCASQFATVGGASVITLNAKPAAGFHLDRWSGSCGGITPTCTVTVGSDVSVLATFAEDVLPAGTNALHVTLPADAPLGLVTSTPAGISCPGTCDSLFAPGTAVTLVSSPNLLDRTRQLQWNADCQAPPVEAHSCTITANSASQTVAPLIVPRPVVNLTVSGPGSVHITPTGLDRNLGDWSSEHCGSGADAQTTCVIDYHQGDKVMLRAQASPGATFLGWGVPDCATSLTCVVKVSAYMEITANFGPVAFTVYPSGTGGITVDPGGTVCSAQCSVRVPVGSVLTLTATAQGLHQFSAWKGCDPIPATPNVCTVVVTSAEQSASAVFDDGLQVEFLVVKGLHLVVFKTGRGIVSASPPRSDGCNPNCVNRTSLLVGENEAISLVAADSGNWKFDHWGTTCPKATDRTCTVHAGPQNAVRATFKRH